ncbi:2'-5' RNA ligase family protein [Nocardiopsis exhalans]|uniref:RNA 2',3'-cyclic phosphodiesterase n=1 Tax=Nocardiopsis exhalans TaxID=163604 RepID=A0ABY5D7R6_9ACTN|nr:2'-5' RNA ligase family protein [Nocardiopsis exhalans]USY19533.1 2'-5' RNA ligase family protein [Nocardiopsis exhalans]
MSLFLALWPSDEARDQLARAVRAARPSDPELRWTPAQEWHLTLVFLGAAGETPSGLSAALERALVGRPALDLALDDWDTFPQRPPELRSSGGNGPGQRSSRGGVPKRRTSRGNGPEHRASVVWAGVRGEGLRELADSLAEAARAAGVPVPSRPFVPHVTLARARPSRDVTDTLRLLGPAPTAGWRADRIHLVQSRPAGPDRYRTVRTWGLPWGSESQRDPERGTS